MNAVGVANLLVFLMFLAFCHRRLRAPWWLVAAVSLSAPLVLIHTTVVTSSCHQRSWCWRASG